MKVNFRKICLSVTPNRLEKERYKEKKNIFDIIKIIKYLRYCFNYIISSVQLPVFDYVEQLSKNVDLPIFIYATLKYMEYLSLDSPANPLIVAISDCVGLKCKTKGATTPTTILRASEVTVLPRTPSNSFNLLQSRRDIDPVPPLISLLSDIPIARRVWQSDLVTETREEGKTKNAQLNVEPLDISRRQFQNQCDNALLESG